jgi:RNA polymerase sigma-70 factor, ECF subfamily
VDVGSGPDADEGAHARTPPTPPSAGAEDELHLVAALVRGDTRALESLYERYRRRVYSLALHLLGEASAAEEVVQETFLKLWRRPGAYQPGRGPLLPWLLGVAHHRAVDLLRRRQLELRFRASLLPARDRGDSDGMEGSREGDPEVCLDAVEQQQLMLRALANLAPQQRVPLMLAYYRGLTQMEIASLLGEPLGTIKTRMRLGLQRLRGVLELAGF